MIRRNRAPSLFIWLDSLSVEKQGAHLEDHSQFGCYTISTLKMTEGNASLIFWLESVTVIITIVHTVIWLTV
jgi:hypothetical protein